MIERYAKLHNIPPGKVEWTGGFWGKKFEKCYRIMIPNMWNLLRDPNISHAFTNFLVAAGIEKGEHKGPPFHDGDFYKWFEAVAHTFAVTKDRELDDLMDRIIEVIGRTQRMDGYIHTPVLIAQRKGLQMDDFPSPEHFVTYNFGHLMTAASTHFLATHKENFLKIAERVCEYLYDACISNPEKVARNSVCPSHYMGVIDLYRVTGKKKYLELAKRLIEIRNLVKDGTDDNQDRIPLLEHTRVIGHAVRANYLYAGVADLYIETGDKRYLEVLLRTWENMAYTKMSITGATGVLYDGVSPYGGENHNEIQRVHQAYGLEYQLPNAIAHNESCAAVGNLLWTWRMLKIFGEARFADIVELVLYNAILGAISLDGTKFFYTNTLRQVNPPFKLRWSRKREPYITCFCCPPNVVRTIAQSVTYAYTTSKDGIWVNLYGTNKLRVKLATNTHIALAQYSEYPWNGYIKIVLEEIKGNPNFKIYLRIPGWSRNVNVSVNRQGIKKDIVPGTYLSLEKNWEEGDVIEMDIPLEVKLIEAHPLVEECRNQVAIMRGPIVYCLEATDLPKGTKIMEVYVPKDIQLKPFRDYVLDEELVALGGEVNIYEEGDWTGKLYRELRRSKPKKTFVKFIPYYAWGNREFNDMTVWLPLD
ncbi:MULTISPECIES: glycoside hydrolase family 127 protein [unclassified Thermotoga]|uniref:glycoside hydrolase family 127 protein n=1 Tax=unclassified Thermotoga TaxID=2631113 RepID=UPI000280E73F|nr:MULTISPECIES: beta-L-arabinofuranosidase domain-containing protein [unclassified Thermotoga]AIY87264.1 hypothetical protein T2812B_08715 [Thermotoga sp. 2812B]EJX26468.1 hypothetical protein EMP_03370 [Thermotoga sp. EMP]